MTEECNKNYLTTVGNSILNKITIKQQLHKFLNELLTQLTFPNKMLGELLKNEYHEVCYLMESQLFLVSFLIMIHINYFLIISSWLSKYKEEYKGNK